MNKSEKVTSALSQMYFYEELILDHLQFIDSNHQTQELADIIINLDDIIIAIQIKERDADSQTNEPTVEQKWFDNKIPKAKQQIKNTLNFIRKEKLPLFKDTRGNEREIQPDAEIIPLVIFFNDVITEYPRKPHLMDTGEIKQPYFGI